MTHDILAYRPIFEGAAGRRGTNQSWMRASNERVVLTLLRRNSDLAKADIARITGLSAQTIARLIASLEADGLILHGEPTKGRIGQPSVPLSLNPLGALFLGLKVGRRSVEMVVTDFVGSIMDREKQTYDYPDFDSILLFAKGAMDRLRGRLLEDLQPRVAGLGIAMPFYLWKWAPKIGVSEDMMLAWKHRDLQAEVQAVTDLPVLLQNDATAACSAEMIFGKAPVPSNTLHFFLAFFIGGGLILGNSMYAGATRNAAAVGSLMVPDLQGNMRTLIDLASLATLERDLVAAGYDAKSLWTSPQVWAFPDDIVDPWLRQAAHALAHGILASQALLDLDAIIIDGWLPRDVLDTLTAGVVDALEEIDLTGLEKPSILAGTAGADARVLGAASLPLSTRYLAEPTPH